MEASAQRKTIEYLQLEYFPPKLLKDTIKVVKWNAILSRVKITI